MIRQNVRSGAATTLLHSPNHSLGLDIVAPGRIVLDVFSNHPNLREIPLHSKSNQAPSRWLTQGSSQDREPVYSADGEWILFTSNRSGNLDLWEVSTKTNALRRITDNPADDWDPAFTSDGKNILWSSNRSGHLEIWMANEDGNGARQVTNDGADAENPTMTRDGNWIVYYSGISPDAACGRSIPMARELLGSYRALLSLRRSRLTGSTRYIFRDATT